MSFLAYLLIGKSGSGKTSFIKQKAEANKLPIYKVGNAPGIEQGESIALGPKTLALKDANLVVDDLFTLTPKEHAFLRQALCQSKRHKSVNVFVGAHSLSFTGVQGLLLFFDIVVFTPSRVNSNDVRYIQRHYYFPDLTPEYFHSFCQRKYGYLLIHMEERKLTVLNSQLEVASKSEKKSLDDARVEIIQILDSFPKRSKSVPLLDLILRNLKQLDDDVMNMHDYSFTVCQGGKEYSASIIDFVIAAQSEASPSKEVFLLKRYFDTKFSFPKVLIDNLRLKNSEHGKKPHGRKTKKKKKTADVLAGSEDLPPLALG